MDAGRKPCPMLCSCNVSPFTKGHFLSGPKDTFISPNKYFSLIDSFRSFWLYTPGDQLAVARNKRTLAYLIRIPK